MAKMPNPIGEIVLTLSKQGEELFGLLTEIRNELRMIRICNERVEDYVLERDAVEYGITLPSAPAVVIEEVIINELKARRL